MSETRERPNWRLPRGVDRALWTYVNSARLASSEEAYFRGHALMSHDIELVAARFAKPGALVDLGCGGGRAAVAMARLGHGVTAVDLSLPMLKETRDAARRTGGAVACVRASLCDLQCFASDAFSYAIMLFSTLGMVRGRTARRQALAEAGRIVCPGGQLAVHAHSYWLNRTTAQGRRWLCADLTRRILGRTEGGDRPMTYRGVPNLIVHQYRLSELREDLQSARWRVGEVVSLGVDGVPARSKRGARVAGWLVFAER